MKKLVLLFAAVFAMTFVSCDNKGTESASKSSDSTENVSAKSGENEVSPSADNQGTEGETATSENQEKTKAGE